ncbi:uncharacterized protein LOC135352971 [Latimeria chalumnae]|uniref:uncharacterized protein LOC135352971 n=1 Tax=Latimeria chalumnae TaxID=7897 RepID=UPI00313BDC97
MFWSLLFGLPGTEGCDSPKPPAWSRVRMDIRPDDPVSPMAPLRSLPEPGVYHLSIDQRLLLLLLVLLLLVLLRCLISWEAKQALKENYEKLQTTMTSELASNYLTTKEVKRLRSCIMIQGKVLKKLMFAEMKLRGLEDLLNRVNRKQKKSHCSSSLHQISSASSYKRFA